MNKKIIIVIGILFSFLACSIPYQFINDGQGNIHLVSQSNQNSEPTPFQPFYPTPTSTPEGYVIQNALVPNNGIRTLSGQINILLLGSDQRPNQGYRTDVVLLVSILTQQEKVRLVSFPRDLYVEIPGMGKERINTIHAAGGFPLLNATFERNFGVHLDHYLLTNFNGFQAIIDTLGGIEINASATLTDRCDLPSCHGCYCTVKPGLKSMDGTYALWYVRSRKSTSDFDRMRRAQEVLAGLFSKLMSMDAVVRAPELYNLFINSVETDLTIGDVVQLVPLASRIASDPSLVQRFSIDSKYLTPQFINGASVQVPDYDAVWSVILQAIYTP